MAAQQLEKAIQSYLQLSGEMTGASLHSIRHIACQRNPECLDGLGAFFANEDRFLSQTGILEPCPGESSFELMASFEAESMVAQSHMAVVLRGRDSFANRPVAIKTPTLPLDSEKIRRFEIEMELTTVLQHPGIPTVLGGGWNDDGRPWFVMEHINGQTLERLISESPADDHFRQRLLSIFHQAARILAYAHARGIVHRDVKTSNIMVGEFEEVQIIDWGLATQSRIPIPPNERSADCNGEVLIAAEKNLTKTGSIVGTTAYMAPESANSGHETIGPVTDVFSMGAVLLEILTKQPAYVNEDPDVQLELARKADLHDAWTRLDKCGADEAIIDLARNCLAREPENRPRNAFEITKAMDEREFAIQSQLRAAEIAAEKSKTRVRYATVLLVTFLAASAMVYWLMLKNAAERNERTEQQASIQQAAKESIRFAESMIDQSQWRQAAAVLNQVATLPVGTINPERFQHAKTLLEMNDYVEQIRYDMFRLGQTRMEKQFSSRDLDDFFIRHFSSLGINIRSNESPGKFRSRPNYRATIDLLDNWLQLSSDFDTGRRLRDFLLMVEPDSPAWIQWLRDPDRDLSANIIQEMIRSAEESGGRENQLLGMVLRMQKAGIKPVPFLRIARTRNRDDFFINVSLGYELVCDLTATPPVLSKEQQAAADRQKNERSTVSVQELKRLTLAAEAISCFESALAIRPENGTAMNNLAIALRASNQVDRAIDIYRSAIAMYPKQAPLHYNLGNALQMKAEHREAIRCYRTVIRLDPEFDSTHTLSRMGASYAALGIQDTALECFQKASALEPFSSDWHGWVGHLQGIQQNHKAAWLSTWRAMQLMQPGSGKFMLGQSQMAKSEKALMKWFETLDGNGIEEVTADQAIVLAHTFAWRDEDIAWQLFVKAFQEDPALEDDFLGGFRLSAATVGLKMVSTDVLPDTKTLDVVYQWLDIEISKYEEVAIEKSEDRVEEMIVRRLNRFLGDGSFEKFVQKCKSNRINTNGDWVKLSNRLNTLLTKLKQPVDSDRATYSP